MKRIIDILGSFLGLLIILPFWPLLALAIKLDSPGPALVKIPRVSGGKIVGVYKFRSMIREARERKPEFEHMNERRDGPFFKIRNDPRVTKVGRLLRRFRIDELPQLINVLWGEMTLVGPRPHEPQEIMSYPEGYHHLPLHKAGATGLSQVSGASSLPFLKELEIDDYYLRHQSLWLDLKIIVKTIAILLFDHNAV